MAFANFPFDPAAARRFQWPFAGLLVAAGLLQLALFAYATAPGLAGTGDSRHYLHAAHTLRETGRLLNLDGTPYRYWPPLFPLLLSAVGSLAGARLLHGACLLGSLLLWSWMGRQLLPARRALVLPLLLALSTPWLLVSKFVWAESVFLLLFAAYATAQWQWLRTGQWQWWGVLTVAGALLPLQRTLGLFLLAGVGAWLLVSGWSRLSARGWGMFFFHLLMSGTGGVLWQWYALLVAGPSRYHPSRGWSQLLSSAADYGFVLGRWLLPLPVSGRIMLPDLIWAISLFGLGWLIWPRHMTTTTKTAAATEQAATPAAALLRSSNLLFRPQLDIDFSRQLMLKILWSAGAALILLVAGLTVFSQSAAGIHDAERYASVLFAPFVLLVLAAWPARAPRWLGVGLVAVLLLGAAVRVGHVAQELRRVPPLPAGSFAGPGPYEQGVGAAGE
ncbi:hypothetical protein ACFP2F_10785 [Hymenobacter artigasi]|uniref:Glycosyltransferase RgtA/B/C/D-like domain-containing protein n=1 Tax=Hymenobacter artigasi TaxID=2719616 RepID=A0ABX1HM85_9BACT|nr:hypothetical protein [Hymenobacter artigasi]NKI90242.1 hypothetical protein [Hymenobacter artigasi]